MSKKSRRRDFQHAMKSRTNSVRLQAMQNDVRNDVSVPEVSSKPAEPQKTPAQLLFQGQLNPTRKRKIIRLEQWVEITIQNGVTVTKQVPSNRHMIRKGQTMWPPPEFVYRRLNFPQGIPDEYAWTCTLTPEMRQYGGCGIQRMLIDDWLEAIEREEKRGDGHVGPTGRGNLPRPAEHGECDCPVCTRNRPLLGHLIGTPA